MSKKKVSRKVPVGTIYINAGFNNTIITATDLAGNVLTWSSSGKMGFKNAQKNTPFASQTVSEDVSKKILENFNTKTVNIIVCGPGNGRESAIRAIQSSGLIITSISDITPTVHNGCRAPKRRRI